MRSVFAARPLRSLRLATSSDSAFSMRWNAKPTCGSSLVWLKPRVHQLPKSQRIDMGPYSKTTVETIEVKTTAFNADIHTFIALSSQMLQVLCR